MSSTIVTVPPKPGSQLNKTLFRPFFDATSHVISTITGAEVTIGAPYRKKAPYQLFDVTGQIVFYGGVIGTACICLPGNTADRLVMAFAGMPLVRGSADFADAVGELANMIAGNAKRAFGVDASIMTPNVILGQNTIAPPHTVPCIAIPGKCMLGEFTVEVCIKRLIETEGGEAL